MARLIPRQDGWFSADELRKGLRREIGRLNELELNAEALKEASRKLPKNTSFLDFFFEGNNLVTSYRSASALPSSDIYLGTIQD